MQINLAGYNLDADLIEELKKNNSGRKDITPETLSAAYARISRDPRPINELRQAARQEVEKARKSNNAIIFTMGHNSVAEHAIFNFDVIGISRLAMEELEKFRLCSFTEKSQRYITLGRDYVLPAEIKNTKFEKEYVAQVQEQAMLYERFFEVLKTYVFEKNKELAVDPKNKNLLEGWAKEDARYITALSTSAQAGMTLNARNLEHMVRRFTNHPLQEIQELGSELYKRVIDIAPSIIRHTEATPYEQDKYNNLKAEITPLLASPRLRGERECILVDTTADADNKLIASLLFSSDFSDYESCLLAAQKMNNGQKLDLIRALNKDLNFYNTLVREYEFPELTFELVVSAACFGQLKRHRMATTIVQDYDPALDLKIPEAITATGLEKEFRSAAEKAEKLYQEIKKELPLAAPYVLTNAHRRRVLIKVNARALYHMSRLREDTHAQWDINQITAKMTALAKKAMPITFALVGGKDKFAEIKAAVFDEKIVSR
jgi:flavin-dependent thymidylate synthase